MSRQAVSSLVSSRRHLQSGLTLVELLIASVLSLLIVAALTQLFVEVARTNREMAKTNSQIENARFAMQMLRNDIVHAGFWAAYVPLYDDLVLNAVPPSRASGLPGAVPDQFYSPCLAFASWNTAYINHLVGMPLLVYDDVPPGCESIVTDRVPETDVLVVRHAETCVAGQSGCAAVSSDLPYFLASNCSDELMDTTPPLYYAVGVDFDPLDPGTPTERDCSTMAPRRLIQHIYYVRDAGDGNPTLVRSELGVAGGAIQQLEPVPLVSGIERLRFVLGLDNLSEGVSEATGSQVDLVRAVYEEQVAWEDEDDWRVPRNRGDGFPDEFVYCTVVACDEDDFINVVAVRVYVLARADEATPGYNDSKVYDLGGLGVAAPNDGFKRHVFSLILPSNSGHRIKRLVVPQTLQG